MAGKQLLNRKWLVTAAVLCTVIARVAWGIDLEALHPPSTDLLQNRKPDFARRLLAEPGDFSRRSPVTVDVNNCNASVLAPPSERRIWLFSIISGFPGSSVLLRHWLDHYMSWGLSNHDIKLVVHTYELTDSFKIETQKVFELLTEYEIYYEEWNETFNPETKMKLVLEFWKKHFPSLHDWIAYADSDEFQNYGDEFETIHQVVDQLEREGHNVMLARFKDRVSTDGVLNPLKPTPSIWEQFPQRCDLRAGGLLKKRGNDRKVVLMRAYLRSTAGNHRVEDLQKVNSYFGPREPGERNPRHGLGGADLRPLVPFTVHKDCFRVTDDGPDKHPITGLPLFKQPTIHDAHIPLQPDNVGVFHFKYHEGLMENTAVRLEEYTAAQSGNQNAAEPTVPGVSKVPFTTYKESQVIYNWSQTGRVPIEMIKCTEDAEVTSSMLDRLRQYRDTHE